MKRRSNKSDLKEIRIKTGGIYRAAAYRLNGETSYVIAEGAYGFLGGKAPGAPDLRVAEVEYGERKTVMIEVKKTDYQMV